MEHLKLQGHSNSEGVFFLWCFISCTAIQQNGKCTVWEKWESYEMQGLWKFISPRLVWYPSSNVAEVSYTSSRVSHESGRLETYHQSWSKGVPGPRTLG